MPENKQDDREKPEETKIIVDDDWKAQAQAEKERLAKEVEQKSSPEAAAPEAPGAGPQSAPRKLPEASFTSLASFIATQAMMALGGMQDPKTKRAYVDLDVAKHHIDSLAVLEEKTKGNLTDDEKKLLDEMIYQVRMQYVEIAQRVSQV